MIKTSRITILFHSFEWLTGETLTFESQMAKEFHIESTQRLAFRIPVDEKLPAGFYRANIYTRAGMIGSVSFRLS